MGDMLREKLIEGAWHGEWECMKTFELQVCRCSIYDNDALGVYNNGA
jgi:hypothetical protein